MAAVGSRGDGRNSCEFRYEKSRCSGTRKSSGVTGELLPHGGGWFTGRRSEFLRIPLREIPCSGTRKSSDVTGELVPHGGGWFTGRRSEFLRIPLREIPWSGTRKSSGVHRRVGSPWRRLVHGATIGILANSATRNSVERNSQEFRRPPASCFPMAAVGSRGDGRNSCEFRYETSRVAELARVPALPASWVTREPSHHGRRLVHGATVGILANSATMIWCSGTRKSSVVTREPSHHGQRLVHAAMVGILANPVTRFWYR
jgi:hypothetical protein